MGSRTNIIFLPYCSLLFPSIVTIQYLHSYGQKSIQISFLMGFLLSSLRTSLRSAQRIAQTLLNSYLSIHKYHRDLICIHPVLCIQTIGASTLIMDFPSTDCFDQHHVGILIHKRVRLHIRFGSSLYFVSVLMISISRVGPVDHIEPSTRLPKKSCCFPHHIVQCT